MNKNKYMILKEMYEETLDKYCDAVECGDTELIKVYESRSSILYSCMVDAVKDDFYEK